MSRYTFNPKLDPNRGRNRRLLIGAIALGAVTLVALALLGFGICVLTGGCSIGNRGPAAEPTPFVPEVNIFAPQGQVPAAPPPASGGSDTPTAPPPAATMDPRGKIEGIDDFVCPNPRPAPPTFGYGIQSNWPVGDIGLFNSIMAEQLKMDWTKAQIRWVDFEPNARGQYELYKWQLLDAFTADANQKGLNILFGVLDAPAWSRPQNAMPGRPDLLGRPPLDRHPHGPVTGQIGRQGLGGGRVQRQPQPPGHPELDCQPGGRLKVAEKIRIKPQTLPPELHHRRRGLRPPLRQKPPGRRPRGPRSGAVALDQGHPSAGPGQLPGDGPTDDPPTHDDHVIGRCRHPVPQTGVAPVR